MSGRVLSDVASRIVETDLPLATLAWDAGFADYETFSRAFKSRFGMPPKHLRELHYIPFKCVERLEPRMTSLDVSLRSRDPETVQEESVHLCGMSFYMDGSEKTFHKPWAMFMQVQRQIENRKAPECFYQYACWSTEGELPGMAIICAVETNGPAEQQPLFVCRTLPPAVYLRFVHKGGFSTLRETYNFIYGEFLASRDIRPVSCWEFQRCGTDADIVEINIPIEII
jgi:AraC family transcriptional regulator